MSSDHTCSISNCKYSELGSKDEESNKRRQQKRNDKWPILFHDLPEDDEELCKLWLKNIHKRNWLLCSTPKICSLHFTDDCYENSKDPHLKKGSIPTVFPDLADRVPRQLDSCIVPSCQSLNGARSSETVSLHALPIRDHEKLKQWISVLRLDPALIETATSSTRICSRHFDKADFKQSRRELKLNAIPHLTWGNVPQQNTTRNPPRSRSGSPFDVRAMIKECRVYLHRCDDMIEKPVRIEKPVPNLVRIEKPVPNLVRIENPVQNLIPIDEPVPSLVHIKTEIVEDPAEDAEPVDYNEQANDSQLQDSHREEFTEDFTEDRAAEEFVEDRNRQELVEDHRNREELTEDRMWPTTLKSKDQEEMAFGSEINDKEIIPVSLHVAEPQNDPMLSMQYTVYATCLNTLYAKCEQCGEHVPLSKGATTFDGSVLVVRCACLHGHETVWYSQPQVTNPEAGNWVTTGCESMELLPDACVMMRV